MLLPPVDAARFLSAYKAMLETAARRQLNGRNEFAEARNAFYANQELRTKPPTADAELLKALTTASCGQFIVCRHMARHTEMVGPGDQVYRVRGITTELREMIDSWMIIQTAVMQFNGIWICDGLIQSKNIILGANMRKDFLAKVRDS